MDQDQKRQAERLYVDSALAECLRVIGRDHGDEYVDQLISAIFEISNVQAALLEMHDEMPPPDIDQAGREAVGAAVDRARKTRTPLI